jgi:hypothetical protein
MTVPRVRSPQQIVYLGADDKIKLHFWNMAEDFKTFFVDKGATKDLVKSTTARIQFWAPASSCVLADGAQ